jgi:peptidoglycan/LPS O-acetylase OafA/YrhL
MALPALPTVRAQRVGFALFGLGLLAIVIDVVPFFFGDHNRSVWLNVSCMLAPIGFIVVVASVFRSGRRTQREAVQKLSAPAAPMSPR